MSEKELLAARRLRIVVADRDPAACRFYREALDRLGHLVCVAGTGPQLVEQCRLLRPDVVVAGADLPGLDGPAAAEQVCREQPVPFILVGGGDDPAWAGRALANRHVLACLHKPVKESCLGPAVLVARGRFEWLQSLGQEVADLRQALEDRKLVERAKGAVMKYAGLGEEEAYRRLRRLAAAQNRKLVEVAQAVLDAGEVFQQVEQQPPPGGQSRGAESRHGADVLRRPPAAAGGGRREGLSSAGPEAAGRR